MECTAKHPSGSPAEVRSRWVSSTDAHFNHKRRPSAIVAEHGGTTRPIPHDRDRGRCPTTTPATAVSFTHIDGHRPSRAISQPDIFDIFDGNSNTPNSSSHVEIAELKQVPTMPTYQVEYINPGGGRKRYRDLDASSSGKLSEQLKARHPGITILKITKRTSPSPAPILPESFPETDRMTPSKPKVLTATNNRLNNINIGIGLAILGAFIGFNLKGNQANPTTAAAVEAELASLRAAINAGPEESTIVWYDFGNGLVNLDRVTRISGNWSLAWSHTVVDDDGESKLQVGSKSGSINATTTTDVRRFVASAPVGAKFSGNSIVEFDLFNLTLSDFKDKATPEAVIEEANLWLRYYAEIKKQLL